MFYLPISRPGLAFQDVPGLRLSTWPPHRRAAQLIRQVPVRDLVQPPFFEEIVVAIELRFYM